MVAFVGSWFAFARNNVTFPDMVHYVEVSTPYTKERDHVYKKLDEMKYDMDLMEAEIKFLSKELSRVAQEVKDLRDKK